MAQIIENQSKTYSIVIIRTLVVMLKMNLRHTRFDLSINIRTVLTALLKFLGELQVVCFPMIATKKLFRQFSRYFFVKVGCYRTSFTGIFFTYVFVTTVQTRKERVKRTSDPIDIQFNL